MDFLESIAANLMFDRFANFLCIFPFLKPKFTVRTVYDQRLLKVQNTMTVYGISYYDDGTKKEETGYKNGKLDGKYWLWGEHGKLKGTSYKVNGLDEGVTTTYHKNGEISTQGMSHEGERIGAWTYWWPNGNKSAEGEFVSSHSVGIWRYWDENGIEKESIDYF